MWLWTGERYGAKPSMASILTFHSGLKQRPSQSSRNSRQRNPHLPNPHPTSRTDAGIHFLISSIDSPMFCQLLVGIGRTLSVKGKTSSGASFRISARLGWRERSHPRNGYRQSVGGAKFSLIVRAETQRRRFILLP